MDIIKTLADEFKIKTGQVENTVKLIDEGNTIPFIARYRKEMTGSLDDVILRELNDRLNYLRNLDEKREQVRNLIAEQEKLTDEINAALDKAVTVTEIDDIYRPFRPKRRTRATIAKEKGLEPLANEIMMQLTKEPVEKIAEKYNVSVTLICDTNHILSSDYSDIIVADAGADSVDIVLVNRCSKGDIVVSQDYGVAAMALGKGAYPIHQNGRWYTNENIALYYC